jgi:hypothetical protein
METTRNGTNSGATIGVDLQARYASDASTFGFFKDTTTFVPVASFNSGVTSQSSVITPSMLSSQIGGLFEWGFRNDTTGQLFSSNEAKNSDQTAHLILFQLLSIPNTYVLAWEDRTSWDYDYNDLILEYRYTMNPSPVPEPMTISLLGAALIMAGGIRRVRRRRQHPL